MCILIYPTCTLIRFSMDHRIELIQTTTELLRNKRILPELFYSEAVILNLFMYYLI